MEELRKEAKNNMAIKGAKTIAEYAIRKWLEEQNFAMEYFSLSMDGNRAKLADMQGESLVLVYRPESRSVYIEESAGQTGKEGRTDEGHLKRQAGREGHRLQRAEGKGPH